MTDGDGREHYHHGNLRDALLDAAEAELADGGVEGLSLRRLARQCGVSQTAPYRHFATKDDLVVALATRAFEEFAECLRQAGAGHADPWRRLKALGLAYFDYARSRPERLRLMFGPNAIAEATDPALLQASSSAFLLLQDAVRAAFASSAEIDEAAATFGAWGLVHGMAALAAEAPGLSELSPEVRRRMVDAALTVYAHGLRMAASTGNGSAPGEADAP